MEVSMEEALRALANGDEACRVFLADAVREELFEPEQDDTELVEADDAAEQSDEHDVVSEIHEEVEQTQVYIGQYAPPVIAKRRGAQIDEAEFRQLAADGQGRSELAARFGVSTKTIDGYKAQWGVQLVDRRGRRPKVGLFSGVA